MTDVAAEMASASYLTMFPLNWVLFDYDELMLTSRLFVIIFVRYKRNLAHYR